MKKIFKISLLTLFFCILSALCCVADDLDATSSGVQDLMDATSTVENGFTGQKQITDEEFQKTIDKIKAKRMKSKKYRKQHNIQTPIKGLSNDDKDSSEYIDETAEKNLILTSPVELITDEGTDIPTGHYKIVGKKEKDGTIHLDFYQAYTLIASIPALETNNDFDEMAINFVKLVPYNSQKIKIIYGSIDFNAYTFVRLKQKITD